jgi:hypothetical protein
MSRKEAHELLLLYRPGFNDPDDEPMQEALELAKTDAELAAWFEQHCQLQRKLAAVFKEIRVPEGLQQQIISERKSHLSPVRRRLVIAAACACILVAALMIASQLNLFTPRAPDTFASFRDRMTGQVLRSYPTMDLVTNSLPAVEHYLEQHRGHTNVVIPPQLANAPATGCAILAWHGHPVSMICFNSGKSATSAASPDLFLFVMERSDIKAAPDNTAPEVKDIKGVMTASWTSGDKVYLLGGFGNEAFLRKYL